MSDIFQRIEKLRLHQNWTWAQVGEALGLKTAMLMMVKSGKRKLSDRAVYRLERAEEKAGIYLEPLPIEHDTGNISPLIFSGRLRKLMDAGNITQNYLAEVTGVTQGAVSGWLKGSLPKVEHIQKIADFFGCPIKLLLSDSEQKETGLRPKREDWEGRAIAAEHNLRALIKGLKELTERFEQDLNK